MTLLRVAKRAPEEPDREVHWYRWVLGPKMAASALAVKSDGPTCSNISAPWSIRWHDAAYTRDEGGVRLD